MSESDSSRRTYVTIVIIYFATGSPRSLCRSPCLIERCRGTTFVPIPTPFSNFDALSLVNNHNFCHKSISNLHYEYNTEANTIRNTASIVSQPFIQSSSSSDKAVCSVRHEAMQEDMSPSTDSESSPSPFLRYYRGITVVPITVQLSSI